MNAIRKSLLKHKLFYIVDIDQKVLYKTKYDAWKATGYSPAMDIYRLSITRKGYKISTKVKLPAEITNRGPAVYI